MMNAVQRVDRMPIQQEMDEGGGPDVPLVDVSPTLCDSITLL